MPDARRPPEAKAPARVQANAPDLVHGVPPIAVSSTTTLANRTGSWKYIRPIYQDKVAPCNATCPVGIDIEGYMNLLREDKVDEARDLLLRENPMPAVTGRVCEHTCETACNRQYFDAAVSIHAVERMLGDGELASFAARSAARAAEAAQGDGADDPAAAAIPAPPRTRKERIAVVGSGPAGLACAYHLARLGYAVEVLEAESEAGGRLRWDMPEYRLPREVLRREIDHIRAQGVTIRTRTRVGVDVTWRDLDAYDAVFVAGAPRRPHPVELPGAADLDVVLPARAFLRNVKDGPIDLLGQRVIAIGGTDVALDAARSAVRMGAKATIVFDGTHAALTAHADAVKEAFREGVRFVFESRPLAARTSDDPPEDWEGYVAPADTVQGDGYGVKPRLVGLDCTRPGEARFFVPADMILDARTDEVDLSFLPAELERRAGALVTDEFGRTSREGFFAGGEAAGDGRSVAHALGSGKRAAIGIDRHLRARAGEAMPDLDAAALRYAGGNMSVTRWRGDDPVFRTNELNEVVPFDQLNMAHFAKAPTHADAHLPVEKRGFHFAETNLGLTAEEAMAEAKRCFNCGVCNACELCLIFCPDVAIKRQGQGFSLSYKYCKGCGVCVEECPRGAMSMTREGL